MGGLRNTVLGAFAALAAFATQSAHAQLIDTAPAPLPTGAVCDGGRTVNFTTSTQVFVTRLEAEFAPSTATAWKIVVWDLAADTIVFESPPIAIAPSLAVETVGVDVSLQFAQGGEYAIAALVDNCALFSVDSVSESPNGFSTLVNGGEVSTFATPDPTPPENGTTDARIKIYGFIFNDFDGDGDLNADDNCAFEPNADQADADGDGLGDVCDPRDDRDFDGDGDMNLDDNCPFDPNADQADVDGDGLGDVCDDANGLDPDGDGFNNDVDNCPFDANNSQSDADGDGIGDACDGQDGRDADNDGTNNDSDNCPFVDNAGQEDTDSDGVGDVCDDDDSSGDSDGDGKNGADDNCPFAANADQADSDGDGVGDVCDFTIIVDGSGCSTTGAPGSVLLALLVLGLVVTRRRTRS